MSALQQVKMWAVKNGNTLATHSVRVHRLEAEMFRRSIISSYVDDADKELAEKQLKVVPVFIQEAKQ